MAKISMDGIIAYALLKNKKSDTVGKPSKQIIDAQFDDNNLIISFDDNSSIKVPFSNTLKHNNKTILDKITINPDGKLMYNNSLVCDLSQAIKQIVLDENDNALVIKYFNEAEEKIFLKSMIEKIFNELQGQGGGDTSDSTVDGMFFHKTVNSYSEMENIISPKTGSTVIVLKDRNNNSERSLYTYTGNDWQFIGSVEPNRDFVKNPIDLQNEVTGVLSDNAISNQIARVSQLHNHNNIDTLNKLSESNSGILLFNGSKIVSNIFYDKNIKYDDINILKFKNFLGKKNADILELRIDISSIDLKDMPKNFVTDKILVSNSHTSSYDLKSIDELVDIKENFSIEIQTNQWQSTGINGRLSPFKYTVNHNLNSTNLIVAFYNNNVNSSNYSYTIVDENNITVKANTNDVTKVVINCSQGTIKGSSGEIIGTDHTHTNLPVLEKFSSDNQGNLYFDGTKIFTNFNPLSYKKVWKQNNKNELSLLLDYATIFKEQDIRIITRSDLLITNVNSKVDDESINKQNTVHLQVIEDDTSVVLDVHIPPQETQKYEVGINPNTKIYIKGFFSGNIILNYFDTSFVQSNEQTPDVDIGNTGVTKNEILNILKTHQFTDELHTRAKTIIEAINQVNADIDNKIIEAFGEMNHKLVSYQRETRDAISVINEKINGTSNDTGNINVRQYILKDVISGTLYTIEDEGLPITHKVIPSVFVLESSEQRKTTMTDFNLNIENIESENGIKIQNNYTLNIVNGETPIINKSEFTNILSLKGGR